MAFRKQTYYHRDEGFDYEKFFFSVFSFTDPIVDGDNMRFTTTFIYQNKEGRPYAQYRVRDKLKTNEYFKDEASFLEKYMIWLDDPDNESFSVYQIYNNFNNLYPDDEDSGPLIKQPLDGYFGAKGEDIPSYYEDVSEYEKSLKNFKIIEGVYTKLLLETFKPQGSYYLPLPIIAFGNLVGVIYFIYNEKEFKARKKGVGIANLKTYYRFLILQATREYERIIVEGNFKKFFLKPHDPLENYWEVFEDLKKPYTIKARYKGEKDLPQPGKKINYQFLYTNQRGKPRRIITENPFLLDLGYDDYYEHLARVITVESQQLQVGKDERVRTAITSIIVDSFAHNIGAHSLVALKWWFEMRYRIAAKRFKIKHPLKAKFKPKKIHEKIRGRLEDTIEFHSFMDDFVHDVKPDQLSLLNIIRFMDNQIISKLWKYKHEGSLVAQFPIPVAQSIYHLFQYLRDKSAFWSGVARDTLFSGRISNWGEIFKIFLNNTLFLGTIAHSEGIKKVFFHVEILDKDGNLEVGGEYAQVNLEVMEVEKKFDDEGYNHRFQNDEKGYSEYAFLRMGDDFKVINDKLKEMDSVFLPNGVIGQHALYTLMENTLRNIKHYKKILPDLKREGVRLFISLQEVQFLQRLDDNTQKYKEDYESLPKYNRTENYPMYKVGAWLHHKQKLSNQVGASINEDKSPFYKNGSVIDAHMQQLRRRVVNEKGQPMLGGSSQDKVCATMLMNNSFISIDSVNLSLVKRQYFPYVYAASEDFIDWKKRTNESGFKADDVILHKAYNPALIGEDSEIRKKNYKTFVKNYIDRIVEEETYGTIKKFFHVWKGEKCILVNKTFNPKHENLARFKILAVTDYKINSHEIVPFRNLGDLKKREKSAEYELRKLGIIRLVEAIKEWDGLTADELYAEAMTKWLGDWFDEKYEKTGVIILKEGGEIAIPVWAILFTKTETSWEIECKIEEEIDVNEVCEILGINYDGKNEGVSINNLQLNPNPSFQTLIVQHGKESVNNSFVCKIRSHTSFFREIFRKDSLSEEPNIYNFMNIRIDKRWDSSFKLLETVLTHITIFDARIYERLEEKLDAAGNKIPNAFRSQLRIEAFPEDPILFKRRENSERILSKQNHFIIIHLSFLEAIYRRDKPNKDIPYKETQVQEFFEIEIVSLYRELFGIEIPHNIILVITSGRGRGDWFQATKDPQITFRPVEALLGAIEDGLSLKDDFQVKYNLCNVLFGS